MKSALLATFALLAAPSLGFATTIPFNPNLDGITFDRPYGRYTNLDFQNNVSTWSENGYIADFSHESIPGPGYFDENTRPTQDYMSDSGCCDAAYHTLEIRREDQRSFSFDGMVISGSATDSELFAFASLFDENGDIDRSISERADLVYDNLMLQGRRADGTLSTVVASSFLDIVENPDYLEDPTDWEATRAGGNGRYLLSLGEPQLNALTEIETLTVTLGVFADDFRIYADSSPFVSLSPIMMQGYTECLLVRRQSSCTVDGVGNFSFGWDSNNQQNYANSMTHGAFFLSPGTATPSPVPLPAGMPLLLAGLGGMVFLRKKQHAKYSSE